jgi:RNA polymerase sigma-70 factor (ECF subfamily)
MLRAFVGIGSLREGSNENAWLHRILRNTWIDQHRRKQCRPQEQCVGVFSDQMSVVRAMPHSKCPRSAEIDALDLLPNTEIRAALDALPEPLRMVVYYADIAGMGCKEIAEIMGSPMGTVMSRLHRARTRLRATLLVHRSDLQHVGAAS